MSWGKIDDQFHAHRKAKVAWRASRGALGLHLLAISYCAGQLTDGLVDEEFVEEKLPAAKERIRAVEALVEAGLWVPESGGWRINDWLDYNPSRADILDKRARDAERKARGRGAESKRSPNGFHAESAGNPNGVREPHAGVGAGVVPTRPDPTIAPLPPEGGRTRDRMSYEGELAEFGVENFPGVPVEAIAHHAMRLRVSNIEPTVDVLRPFLEQHQPVEAA